MPKLLIIDDDDAVRDALSEALSAQNYEIEEAASGRQGLGVLADQTIDGVFLDLRMPGMDGLDVLKKIRGMGHPPPVVVLTAHATAENTIEAMRLGAYDHLTKPITRADILSLAAQMAVLKAPRLEEETRPFDGMIGASAATREVQKKIGLVADGASTVLITGETGTGKEVVAQAIHRFGDRAAKPFVALNCAAVPAELMESELFGHAKGAFTGALAERAGAFVEADGGILFLDEIGDMALPMQGKMLRALQEQTIAPIGGKSRKVNVRIIAATHRDLDQRVRDGRFREDLLYRLNVVPIHIPPLRERRDDILPLAEHFLRQTGRRQALHPDAKALLFANAWPGNVRQLKNAMERASLFSRTGIIDGAGLAFLDAEAAPINGGGAQAPETLPVALEKLEIFLVKRALTVAQGNRAEAARLLNIPRQQLYVKLKKYGL